jgi:LPPG:FO 2-phospho-L-lactate transferase
MKVVALAGGVGGAKLVDGFAQVMPHENLTVIVNTGDDFKHLGLVICPDLDTICYTLAGNANPETGWGLTGETWNAMESLANLEGPTWFRLGDKDLGTHMFRTHLLQAGSSLSQVVERFCQTWEIGVRVLPMSDHPAPTWLDTDEGELTFQEYFVLRQCNPRVRSVHFKDRDRVLPAPGVLEAIHEATVIVICPSNPWISIDPILAVPGVRSALTIAHQNKPPILAVSPIIGGKAIKGPAAKIFAEMGIEPSALAVAEHYGSIKSGGLLAGFVIDSMDNDLVDPIKQMEIEVHAADSLMKTSEDRRHLAREVLEFGRSLLDPLGGKTGGNDP